MSFEDISDFLDIIESTGACEEKTPSVAHQLLKDIGPSIGQVTKYSKYKGGYVAVGETIDLMPPGCYDIEADNSCVYAVPTLKQQGLLLDLPEMKSNEVIDIVKTFWESEDDYKKGNQFVNGGALYKAGIMMFGPPGSGKSCILKLVSNHLIKQGGIVFYGDRHPIHILKFLSHFSQIEDNRKCILLLEDIDSLIHMYGESIYLEMLDSAKTINNVLFIATTNYPDRLDPRIYNRPGRFSHVIKVGLPTKNARISYLKAILKDYRDIDYIVENSAGFTIDHLTALINAVYREKKDLKNEIKRLQLLFKIPKIKEDSIGIGINSETEE